MGRKYDTGYRKTARPMVILVVLLVAYCMLLMKLIILKDVTDPQAKLERRIETGLRKANFTPFKTILYYGTFQEDLPTGLQNVGGNILLFIPVGFLLTALLNRRRLLKILLFTLLISAIFEFIQLITGYGTCDVDDLLLNTTGGLIGYGLFILAAKIAALFRQ